jgi:hypothetical protein
MSNNQFNGKIYDEVWSDRFNFFQQHGAPNSKNFKNAVNTLSGIQKLRININFYAFFFGFIYFLIKGMWKGAITLVILNIFFVSSSMFLPGFISNIFTLIVSLISAFAANYTYYRKVQLGEDDFNIFKGIRL